MSQRSAFSSSASSGGRRPGAVEVEIDGPALTFAAERVLALMRERGSITVSEAAERVEVGERQAQRILREIGDARLAVRSKEGRHVVWRPIDE